ncbi:hypothetical protein PAXINDRAFT_180247 [Paxillus involutus ATCC 200175]|nr:hypothetical protein PAXINDRAFT_180247 [Paxillus involutus ATCC 200175]
MSTLWTKAEAFVVADGIAYPIFHLRKDPRPTFAPSEYSSLFRESTRVHAMSTILPSRHPKYRSKLCRYFIRGNCPFGATCSFLHPPPGMLPPSGSFSRQLLVNWNALFPQSIPLSDEQGAPPTQSPDSPPSQSQRPQLIDEDPSPSNSLLLSASDCTNSEPMPQARQHDNGRKKYPCRHFARTKGWCPVGDQCKFNHDLSAVESSATVQEPENAPHFDSEAYSGEGRTISGGVLVGVLPPFQNIDQECSEYPSSYQYTHAEGEKPYPEYVTYPWYWPCQPWQPHPAYYASYPVPVPTGVPMPTAPSLPPPSAVMQHSDYPPQIPTEFPSGLPAGSVEINGTTYFSPPTTHVPPPPPLAYIAPVHQVPYGQIIPPPYPYYPPPPPTNYHTAHSPSADMWHETPFDPFASDAPVPEELPIPQRCHIISRRGVNRMTNNVNSALPIIDEALRTCPTSHCALYVTRDIPQDNRIVQQMGGKSMYVFAVGTASCKMSDRFS